MKPLRNLLDKLHPHFTHGGKLEKLYPLYEALDTFTYTPGEVTDGAPHVRDAMDLKRVMITVVLALIPCFFMAMWNTGYQANSIMQVNGGSVEGWRGVLLDLLGYGGNPDSMVDNLLLGAAWFVPIYLVTNIVGGLWEALFCIVRRHELNEGFLVTGSLFPLICPPTLPLWQVALGISFGVVIGKEIFGGTGKNFLNPALDRTGLPVFRLPGTDQRRQGLDRSWTASARQRRSSHAAEGGVQAVVARHQLVRCLLRPDPGLDGRDLDFGLPVRRGGPDPVRHRFVAHHVVRARQRGGHLPDVQCDRQQHQPDVRARPALAPGARRVGVRPGLHGHRPGVRGHDRRRPMDLRLPDRCDVHHDSRRQPGLPGGDDARHPVRQRLCAVDRPAGAQGSHQEEAEACPGIVPRKS